MTRTGSKLGLLLWKNWKLQARHPIQTVVEIAVPVLFAALILVIRLLADPEEHTKPTTFPSFNPIVVMNGSYILNTRENISISVAWSTKDDSPTSFFKEVEDVMQAMKTGTGDAIGLQGFKSAGSMEKFLLSARTHVDQSGSVLYWAGITLEDTNSESNPTVCSPGLQMTVRFPGELRSRLSRGKITPYNNWKTNLLFPMFQLNGPREETAKWGPNPPYAEEGFLAIQALISYSLMAHCLPKKDLKIPTSADIRLRRFSYPEYTDDPILLALESIVSSMLMLGFVYTCIATIKSITTEKEHQVKEAMKIMGLPTALHWIAWFIKTMILLLISGVLITVLFMVKANEDVAVFTYGSGTVLFVFLTLYMIATTMFCFMVSVFFSKANTAATVGGLAWFLTYMPYSLLQMEYEDMSLTEKLLASLSFNTAMGYGFRVMIMHEGTGTGQHWNNLFDPATQDDKLALGYLFLMLIADSFIYMLITLYVEAVFPGDYGVPKPWYFPFQKSFWCGPERHSMEVFETPPQDEKNFEMEPSRARAGVQIRNLRKVFNGNKVAVDNLTLNMYEGQITVLLGHNGAGKTTTMSMLTGVYTPTSGTATVNGYDVVTDIDSARDSLGLCPQHNVLFDELTVREHLFFFGKLKGLSGKELEEEIRKYLQLLQLEPKEHKQSRTLSGGMKRKLAAGVALCGKSKVVMFDEPTSGMDPAARRALWDLLREEKAGRTLLLTTHFMDEADLLGDRIAIMAGGRLQCCGSPFFLKKRYGAGYRLVVVKGARCDAAAVTALLARHVAGLAPAQDVGSELSFQLDDEHASRFEPMLRELEQQREALHVLSYGVSLTTMEEVFMKVGKDHEVAMDDGHYQYSQESLVASADPAVQQPQGDAAPLTPKSPPPDMTHEHTTLQIGGQPTTKGNSQLLSYQLQAMFMKKGLALLRGWVLILVHFLLPIIFLIIAILMGRMWEIATTLPSRDIDLQEYTDARTVLAEPVNNPNIIVSTFMKQIATNYKNVATDNDKSTLEVLQNQNDPEGSIHSYLLDQYRKNEAHTRRTLIAGASFDVNETTANFVGWFNDQPYHSAPLALNLVYNAFLKLAGVSLALVNYPLPYTHESQATLIETGNNIGFQIAFNFGFSMAFVASYYILFPIKERISKAKHLQFVSGVNVIVFWGVHLLCDFMSFLLPALGVIITLAAFQEEGFATFAELGRIFAVLLCFGWAMLPLMYLSSFFFTIPASGYTRMAIFNLFIGNAGLMVVSILQIPGIDQQTVADVLQHILMIVPHYSMADAVSSLSTYSSYVDICVQFNPGCAIENICCPENCPSTGCVSVPPNYFQFGTPGIGKHILYLLGMGCVFNILLLLVEFHCFDWLIPTPGTPAKKKHGEEISPEQEEDSDVLEEREKICSSELQDLTNNFSLVLRDVTKYYGKFLAVDHICIGVKRAECFGLLGVNGAGKTTTFKMMTGDERISRGEAFLEGLSLKGDMKQVHQLIGYCPQFDALIEEMTGRETLKMFCLLRGIPSHQIPRISRDLADELLFTKHLDKKVKEYSGGNKRKLSTAVALIGDPPVVFLDEPTTGMDPVAKRHLWNVICKVRDRGKSIILTSHSMEECEALCTRLVIMVNGTFRCLGSTQHLKSKFAEGYTLIIKVGNPPPSSPVSRTFSITSRSSLIPDLTTVKNFVETTFPGSLLREDFMGLLTYYIPSSTLTWSQMFGIMKRAKQELHIEDYSLGQTSLEQVFLSFTKSQVTESF